MNKYAYENAYADDEHDQESYRWSDDELDLIERGAFVDADECSDEDCLLHEADDS